MQCNNVEVIILEKKNSTLEKMDYMRKGGSLECPFCKKGMMSMVSKGVFRCNKCNKAIVGRVNIKIEKDFVED